MRSIIGSEIYKIIKQKFFLYLIGGATVLAIITIGLNQMLAGSHPQIVNTGSNILVSSLSNISVSIILCTIFIHFHIGKEFTNRTITSMIESGFSRRDIYLSKVIICVCFCAVLILVYPIVSSVGTTCLRGWGNDASIIYIVRDVLIFLFINFFILAFCILLDFIVESKSISLIINMLVVGVGSEILIGLSTELPVLEKILNFMPIGKINLIGGTMAKKTDYVTALVSSVIWSGVILLIGYYRFRKLDIK